MAEQILFLRKNNLDQEVTAATIGVTGIATSLGDSSFLRNRSNSNGLAITAATSDIVITCNFAGAVSITNFMMVYTDVVNYLLEYKLATATVNPVIKKQYSATVRSQNTYFKEYERFQADQLIITITDRGDRRIAQLIVSDMIGRLNAWAEITNPEISSSLSTGKMINGKSYILEGQRSFSVELKVDFHKDPDDMSLLDQLFNTHEGFLTLLCGGDQSAFFYPLEGYRLQDIYLMRPSIPLQPDLYKAIYVTGMVTKIKLVEVVS